MKSARHHALAAILILILSFCGGSSLRASSVSFDGVGDLDASFVHAKTAAMAVTHVPGSGVGGSGALRLQGVSNNDAGFAAVYSPATFDATGSTNVWTTSLAFDTRSLAGDPAPFLSKEKEKLKVAVGFSGTNNLQDPRKFFDKKNTNSSTSFRAQLVMESEVSVEHDTGKQLRFRSRIKSFPAWDQEQNLNFPEFTVPFPGPYDAYASWYRMDFTVEFLGGDQLRLTGKVFDLGLDGGAVPVLVSENGIVVTNAAFAGYTTVYAAMFAEVEKKASRWKTFHIDNFTVDTAAVLPSSPVALAASNVLATAAVANWEAPGSGAGFSGYVVELTTAADNFAPNTFLDANGNPGNASGIEVNNASAVSQVLGGLSEGTEYVYRVRSRNRAGVSAPSGVISFTTQQTYVNAPPTLNPIANIGPLWPNSPPVTVPLSGITAGLGDTGQSLTVTATSSDALIVGNPSVAYSSPDETGTLTLVPAGGVGSATITVVVDDGESVNNTITRTFTVTTRIPPPLIDFEDEASVTEEFLLPNSQNASLSFDPEGGTGDPPTGGLHYQGAGTNDNGMVFLRQQPYFMNPLPSLMRNSILINGRELAQDPAGTNKHQAEVEIGFRNQVTPFDSKAKDFFSKGDANNRAATVRLQFRHEPAKGSVHEVRARLRNYIGTSTSGQSPEIGVAGDVALFQDWLRVTLDVVPLSLAEMLLVYRVEHLGPDGTDTPQLVFADSLTVTNPGFLTAPKVYAGFVLSTEKNMPGRGLSIDRHRVEVLYTAPDAPIALPATNVTSTNALLRWQRGEDGAVPFSYVVELSTDPTFPSGSFIAADGSTGQASGFALANPNAQAQQVTGLLPGTTYYYRVRGANGIGESENSEVIAFTTLAAGVNAPPTLAPIADLFLIEDAGPQTVLLKGISDGGELNQTVTISATTDDPALIQNLTVDYNSPLTTGNLLFTPAANVTGSASITVTANDGAGNNNTTTRTFTVSIIRVDELIPFDTASQLEDLTVAAAASQFVHLNTGGVGQAPGQVAFTRDASNSDKAAMALRPYAYDARAAGYWITSVFVKATEIGTLVSGKDKMDVRLGFVATDQPADNLKDTFHKVQTGLGVKFKLEHEPGKADKQWLIEAEAYSSAPAAGGGFNESKGSKRTGSDPGGFENWLKLVTQVIRKSATQYEITYAIEDWGPDGQAKVATLLSGPAFTATNASFAKDPTIFAGFLIEAEKSQQGTVFLDNHEVIANTKAPDAPQLQPAFDVSSSGFTVAWNPAVIGRAITGFVVQLVQDVRDFLTGLFLGTDGSQQSAGVVVNDPNQQNLEFQGLNPGTEYHWRVIAYNDEDSSLPLEYRTTRTDALSYQAWRELHFDPEDLFDDEISGPNADPNGNGMNNLLEFALGGNPIEPGGPLVEHALDENGRLTITFRRRAGSVELIYDVQVSSDLREPWQSLTGGPVAISEVDADGMETVTFRDTGSANPNDPRFMRVRVELIE